MKVLELIELLKQMPQDKDVAYTNDFRYEVCDISVELMTLYKFPYEDDDDWCDFKKDPEYKDGKLCHQVENQFIVLS